MNYKNNIYVRDIIKNNGSCTGFTPSQVKDFYPSELHPIHYPIPIQNGEGCNLEHSLMVMMWMWMLILILIIMIIVIIIMMFTFVIITIIIVLTIIMNNIVLMIILINNHYNISGI